MENINELKQKFIDAIERICKDYEEKHLPEFKVGQWIIGMGYVPKSPARIIKVESDDVRYLYWNDNDKKETESFQGKMIIRPATPQEIESHLRKICDEKGYKEGIKIKNIKNGEIQTIDNRPFWYSKDTDSFYCWTSKDEWENREMSNPSIYSGGKFAEIITDKKKLPKTKEEFNLFLGHWSSRHTKTTKEFLEDYED